ncbi:AbrB family transcriptional regulator [Evansella sp. AB-P1]|uniref:AbrB family transcriptional regulator n=1 Tax=Evansella sp. AB-P1 TaxID=3037653 RepID=UPI00241DB0F8|nr:AbrB family transcriptional regulator [Evansella sp. AB-P1]MDG5787199.1 AbrB family transcriptional regulator [Evansella sp. AB-P1]
MEEATKKRVFEWITKWGFWPFMLLIGYIFYILNIPAGWLIGSMVASMAYSLFIGPRKVNNNFFAIGLAMIGLTLGAMLDLTILWETIRAFGFYLLLGLVLIIGGSLILCHLFYKTSGLDKKTAYYSLLPGGASEVLALADRHGADAAVVASFHTARIAIFVILMPLLAGAGLVSSAKPSIFLDLVDSSSVLIPIAVLLVSAIAISRMLPIQAGTLFYATFLALVWSMGTDLPVPILLTGIGQVFIGTSIGLKFDPNTFKTLRRVGLLGLTYLMLLVGLSIGTGGIFSILTGVDFWSSVLGWTPAGAAEMSSTAIFLDLDQSAVIMLQFIRLYAVFFSLPLLAAWLDDKQISKGVMLKIKKTS